jgi:hypothetical protein
MVDLCILWALGGQTQDLGPAKLQRLKPFRTQLHKKGFYAPRGGRGGNVSQILVTSEWLFPGKRWQWATVLRGWGTVSHYPFFLQRECLSL